MPTSVGHSFLQGVLVFGHLIGIMITPLSCLRLLIYMTTKCDEFSEKGQFETEPILFGCFVLALLCISLWASSYDTRIGNMPLWCIILLSVTCFCLVRWSVEVFLRGPVERHCEYSCKTAFFGDKILEFATTVLNNKSSASIIVTLAFACIVSYHHLNSRSDSSSPTMSPTSGEGTATLATVAGLVGRINRMKLAHHLPNTLVDPVVYPECSMPPT